MAAITKIPLELNFPPKVGQLNITPVSGIALNTEFTIEAINF